MFQSEFLDALIDLPTSSRVTALEPFYCRRFFQCHEATLAHRKHDGLDHDVRRRAMARIVDLIPGLLERHAGLRQASLLPTRRHDETSSPGRGSYRAGVLVEGVGEGAHQAVSACVAATRRDGREPSRVKLRGLSLIRASAQVRTASES